MIENLAIKGGGVKGVAYIGALEELEKYKIVSSLKRVAGTSAGSLMSLMIACGYTVPQMKELMLQMDFNKFKSGFNPFRIFTQYGLHSGNYLLQYAQKVLAQSPLQLQANATFEHLAKAGGKELYVFACNINRHTVQEFSARNTPHTLVAEAIRASMSIPYFFKAWIFANGKPTGDVYVDGGVVYNYPLSFFDDPFFNPYPHVNFNSFGLYLFSNTNHYGQNFRKYAPVKYTSNLFEALIDTQDIVILSDKEQVQRSILIDDLQIPATDFNITPAQKEALINSGKKGAFEYLKNYNTNYSPQSIQLLDEHK
jgi:NTE family protein